MKISSSEGSTISNLRILAVPIATCRKLLGTGAGGKPQLHEVAEVIGAGNQRTVGEQRQFAFVFKLNAAAAVAGLDLAQHSAAERCAPG